MRNYQHPLKLNFVLLGKAQEFYNLHGFQNIEVPWVIDKKYVAETKPSDVSFYETLGGVLVASAEQSFIQMMEQGWNELGSYQATTPCFRDENHDNLHSPYFMKTELFDNKNVNEERLHEIIDISLQFFNFLHPGIAKIENMADGTYDIVGTRSGIELGSYGIRERLNHSWIYATGIALPRFEQVMEHETLATKSGLNK